jgi:hypothetical protein
MLSAAGTYRIVVTSFRGGVTGNYTLSVAPSGTSQPGLSASTPLSAAASPNRPITPDAQIAFDAPVEGTLSESDNAILPSESPRAGVGYYRDGYTFEGAAGDAVRIDFTGRPASAEAVAPGLAPLNPSLDGYLVLAAPSGAVESTNDDFTGPSDARIETVLAESGPYRIVVTSFGPNATGRYRLNLTAASLASE